MMVTINITEDDLYSLACEKAKKMGANVDDFGYGITVPMMLEGSYDKEIIVEFEKSDD